MDLISRQQAIDALHMDTSIIPFKKAREYADATISEIRNRLEKLPSTQPEIIYCKDCKHHWTYKCMDSMPIERCDLEQTFYDAEIDYCSLAERREDG